LRQWAIDDIMVRLKHRYLLVNILFPSPKSATTTTRTPTGQDIIPYGLQFRSPSSDKLDARLLLRVIRDGVAELYGDYGSGKVSPSLQSEHRGHAEITIDVVTSATNANISKVPIYGNEHSDHPGLA